MQYVISVHTDPNHFEIKTEGVAEVSGFNSFLSEIFEHPRWEPGADILFDHRNLILSSFRTEDVRSVSKIVTQYIAKIGNGKWAFIISGNFAYGMTRMWQIITEEKAPMEINIFKDRDEALDWLLESRL